MYFVAFVAFVFLPALHVCPFVAPFFLTGILTPFWCCWRRLRRWLWLWRRRDAGVCPRRVRLFKSVLLMSVSLRLSLELH